MRTIIGIDTGGTYTDAVVLAADTKALLFKSKTETKHALDVCIRACFAGIPEKYLCDVSRVCLSTTLATNAIVEGRGCEAGLILIGKRPDGELPSRQTAFLDGLYDIKGRQRRPLDEAQIQTALEQFAGRVEALAISGYASVRNPAHEIHVAERAGRVLGVPVVCAHELSTDLGFYERTVTAALNARLIPLICSLIRAVHTIMEESNVDAPLMVVRGDGTLMTEARAMLSPIDTLLSGPAASAAGGAYLAGERTARVIDIGGTTTDIIDVHDGAMRNRDEGAKVGGWLTRVRAAEIFTLGLGGDSWITECDGEILVGPRRVLPACRLKGESLEDVGSGLTPTDVLHCMGDLRKWDAAAAKSAAGELADRCGCTEEALLIRVKNTIRQKLGGALSDAQQYFGDAERQSMPIVMIGASAALWSKRFFEAGAHHVIVPEHADVANAVGTAVGQEIEKLEMLIRYDEQSERYIAYTPLAREVFTTLDEASRFAISAGEACMRRVAEGRDFHADISKRDITLTDAAGEQSLFVERQILLCARFS